MKRRRCGSADAEAVEPVRLFVVDLDVFDLGVTRPAADEFDEPLHRVLVTLEDRLDGAVGTVADPAGYARRVRLALRRIAEEHSLHPAVRDDAPPDHTATAVNARNSYAMFAARSAVT